MADDLRTALSELASDFETEIDWSSGRNNYGDNEAYAKCARDLRALLDRFPSADQWKVSDGDTKCQSCRQPNGAWFADNDIWNAVLSGRVAGWLAGEVLPQNDPGGCLCPRCFMLLARERGMDVVWRVLPEWSGRALRMDFPALAASPEEQDR